MFARRVYGSAFRSQPLGPVFEFGVRAFYVGSCCTGFGTVVGLATLRDSHPFRFVQAVNPLWRLGLGLR